MAAQWIWWMLAALLVGAELLTGTFYLLAVGIAFALGGVVAWLGASNEVQLVVGAVCAGTGVLVAHWWRGRLGEPPHQGSLDIGQTVRVEHWRKDGTARVMYRGTLWDAEPATPQTPHADVMTIVAMRGSTLILGPKAT